MSVSLPSVSDETRRPASTRPLGEVIKFRNEIVHPKDNPRGNVTFVGLEHVESHTGVRIGSEQVRLEEMTGRRARFRAGDIIYGYLRPYLNKVWIAEFDGICSVDQYVFNVRPIADRNYVAHFLRSARFLETAPVDSTPGQLPRIRSGEIAGTPIPFPPLDEQKRIAAILDQADDLRRKRRQALELLKKLKSTDFSVTFLNPSAPISLGRINDLTASTQYGTSSKAGEAGDFPILRMGNLTYDGNMDTSELKYINLIPKDVSKYTVEPGDILFNRTNSPDLVGKTAVFHERTLYAFAGYLVRLRVNERAVPEYISAYLNSKRGKAVLRGMCKAIIGMANINAQELRSIPIPLAPLDLQRAFAARAAEIDDLRARHRAQLARLDALFASLQHRAFRCEL